MNCNNCKQWHELSISQQEQLKLKNQEITDQRNSKYVWIGATVFACAFGIVMFGIMVYNLKTN